MKANEMPERIYLFDYNEAMVTPLEGDTMYVREDVFIEKAVKYVANHFLAPGMDNEIKDFVNYMKRD